ncbi:MAG TPA: glycine zipper 2TM domain-containing protein [Candidatus Saccharimonadia bacterium]|nr:glycine zipper 2TM domain-containing protein [Candidatus Saccharimonadia bacterium]
MTKTPVMLVALALAFVLQLAAAPADARPLRCGNCGTVLDVDNIWYEDQGGRGDSGREGAVVGAIIGGLLGNQVGGGSGRKAATVGGAVAGGLIGHRIDRNDDRGDRGFTGKRVEIRMDRGGYRTVEVHGDMRIYRGDRVRVHQDRLVSLD